MTLIRPKTVTARPTSEAGVAIVANQGAGRQTVLAMTAAQAEGVIIDLLLSAKISAENQGLPHTKTMQRGIVPLRENTTEPHELGFSLTADHQAICLHARFGEVTIPILVAAEALKSVIAGLSEISAALQAGSTHTQ